MTRTELLELAALDAFGLLDAYESDLYTRSFHHAPAAVQDEIKLLQAELAGDDTLLPDVTPPATLRKQVLDRVALAIEEEASHLAPVGTIGRRPASAAHSRRPHLTATGQMWRAASFAMAAAGLVLAIMFSLVYQRSNELADAAINGDTSRLIAELGPMAADYILDDTTRRISLRATQPDVEARAVVFIAEAAGTGFLVIENLPRSRPYEIRFVTEDGRSESVREFASDGGRGGIQLLELPMAAMTAVIWEVAIVGGETLLTSAA